jgi:AcrR family transcriptional regulator
MTDQMQPMRSRQPTAKRRGPRFTHESTEDTAQRICDAAVQLVRTRGLNALSFSTLAKHRTLRVTRTAPLHYFGSTVGLLAAIAASGFDELRNHLSEVRTSGDASERTVKALGLSYAAYAFQHEHLHRAMHAADLWRAVTAHQSNQKRATKTASTKAQSWVEKAIASRDATFAEFVIAVRDAQKAGRLRNDVGERTDDAANFITAVVDGFLFQHFEERVTQNCTPEERMRKLERFLDLALGGLCVSH